MEYNINSHTRTIQDYLIAIEYEINLESLRRLRKKRLGKAIAHVSERKDFPRRSSVTETCWTGPFSSSSEWCGSIQTI